MSDIAAIINFDGAPAERDGLARMTAVMSYRQPDGLAAHRRGPAALRPCRVQPILSRGAPIACAKLRRVGAGWDSTA
jgi:hypothetical protein